MFSNLTSADFADSQRSLVLATIKHDVDFKLDSAQIKGLILWAALAALAVGASLRILQRLLR